MAELAGKVLVQAEVAQVTDAGFDGAAYHRRACEEGRAFLDRVDAILPSVSKRRYESEAQGKVSDATVADIRQAGFFRPFTPMRYGGLEIDPASYFDGLMRLAGADPSAAWIAGQLAVHSFEVALMSEQMQDDFWGESPDVVASSSYAPIGNVEVVDGGYRLNGTWTFSSGVDHATWVIMGAKDRAFVVPVAELTVDHSSWRVSGLQGTGSKSVTAVNVFVPEYRVHKFLDTKNHENPGWAVNDRPLYHVSFSAMFNAAAANTMIGATKHGIDMFVHQARVRHTRMGTGVAVAGNPHVHLKIANAMTRHHDVQQRHLNRWRDLFALACEGTPAPRELWMRMRFETADAIATCYDVLHDIWPMAGAIASSASNDLQQVVRDVMSGRNHGTAGRELAATMYVQTLFGVEPPEFEDFGTLAYYA